MYKKLLKYFAIFIGVGGVVGGLTAAFVIAGQKNNALNQRVILNLPSDNSLRGLYDENKLQDNPQYQWDLNITNTKFTVTIDNITDLDSPLITISNGDTYFKSNLNENGDITLTTNNTKWDDYPKPDGKWDEKDPLRHLKGIPTLTIKSNNIKHSVTIYLVVNLN